MVIILLLFFFFWGGGPLFSSAAPPLSQANVAEQLAETQRELETDTVKKTPQKQRR